MTRVRLQVNLSRQLVELARETDTALPSRGVTAGGDPLRLRGIPCAGFGGAIRGTRPDDCIVRLDREGALAVLARDLDGTSPGTQPEQALLAKEAVRLDELPMMSGAGETDGKSAAS